MSEVKEEHHMASSSEEDNEYEESDDDYVPIEQEEEEEEDEGRDEEEEESDGSESDLRTDITIARSFLEWMRRQRAEPNEPPKSKEEKDPNRPCEFYENVISYHSGGPVDKSRIKLLAKREIIGNCCASDRVQMARRLLPKHRSETVDTFGGSVFCGKYSKDGTIFMSASQDGIVALYDTTTWKKFKEIEAREVGWSIIDVDFSPDQRFVIYSTWSQHISLCNVFGEYELHEQLMLAPGMHSCMFGIRFDPGSTNIVAGLNHGRIILYDVSQKRVVSSIEGHNDDVNSVCFDGSSDVFYTGSDDYTIKIWDRRSLSGTAAGTLHGHRDGITCVSSKGDGIMLLSNGKDMCLKLWDLRKMSSAHTEPPQSFSHRHRGIGGWGMRRAHEQSGHDASLVTFRGHGVARTLIRCGFSSMSTTGQRYVFTGSVQGTAHIYDILTEERTEVGRHSSIVRSCDWHPEYPEFVTTSWDCSIQRHLPP